MLSWDTYRGHTPAWPNASRKERPRPKLDSAFVVTVDRLFYVAAAALAACVVTLFFG